MIIKGSILLAKKTEESGKIKCILSNVLRSSVFFSHKDGFVFIRVFTVFT